MKPSLWSFASLIVLAFAGWQAFATLSRTPAFNLSLRVETPAGGTIPMMTVTTYSRAAYFAAIAEDWQRQSDAAPGVEAGGAMTEEARREGYVRARDAARESLRHNPGEGATWMTLAKAEAGLGRRDKALAAWLTSRELAPYRATASLDRLYFLIGFMSEPEGWELALATIPPEVVREELASARTRQSLNFVTGWLSEHPAILAFLAEADAGH